MRASRLFIVLFSLFSAFSVQAKCDNQFINPVTDISWSCIFPIRLGGVAIKGGGPSEDPSLNRSPVCVCKGGKVPRVGIKASFWEPSRIIDTVSDPYCMMPLGTKLSEPKPGTLGGGLSNGVNGSGRAFQQMHFYIFPAWKVLDMFLDLPCIEDKGVDVLAMTEIMPNWNSEILSLIVNPEAILFANPVTGLACSADAVSALGGMPRNELFWCMGSWGNAYPLAGSITSTDYTEANAGLAARGIFMMGRLGMLQDTSEDGCSFSFSPIWKKNRYKLQMMRPVRDSMCLPIGREGMLWDSMKHPLTKDNFMWMLFKKVDCCVSY